MNEKVYYEWVNIARGIGMFLVVLGHACMCVGIANQFLFNLIYSFHMPLFFFISGFCSAGLFKLSSFVERFKYSQKRALRLMVPYFAVGIVYILLDNIMGITDLYDNGIYGVFLHMLRGDNPNWQLWTLYALFGCSTICAFLMTSNMLVVVGMSIFLQIIYCTSLVGIGYCTITASIEKNLVYFVAGLLLRKFYGKKNIMEKVPWFVFMIALICLVSINILIFNVEVNRAIYLITAPLGIFAACFMAVKIQAKNNPVNKVFNLIGEYCMDIYIFANLCQVLVRKVLFNLLEVNEWLVLFVSVFMGIIVPIIFSKKIVRKKRIISSLFLGRY